jgi:SAM-dependent methyltransferase
MTDNQQTRTFYETQWELTDGINGDARRWEDLRPCAADYVHGCRLRPLVHVPPSGENFLDAGSGPIDDDDYWSFSKNFQKRYCVDFSQTALDRARQRLGDRGVYLRGDFLDVDLPPDHFDCTLCYYVLFHVSAGLQEEFVRKMLRVTRPGAPVIVTYTNHDDLLASNPELLDLLSTRLPTGTSHPYYHSHPQNFWQKFEDVADVELHPLRTLETLAHKLLVPDGQAGRDLLNLLYQAEEAHPDFFVRRGHYYTVTLRKRPWST